MGRRLCRRQVAASGAISIPMAAMARHSRCRRPSPRGRRSTPRCAARFPPRYHMGAALSGVEDREGGVAVDIDGVGRLVADLLCCAEGAQSASGRRLLPDVTPSYAGYVAWRGTLDEADAPAELVRF